MVAGPGARIGRVRELAPGLALALALGLAATLLAGLVPWPVPPVVVAVLAGVAVVNVIGLPRGAAAGVGCAARRVLRLGVVLLGADLVLGDVAAIGATSVAVIVACMATALATVALLSRLVGVPPKLALLIGVGTAVCGNSAIAATAPVIEADERDVSFAVGTITIFGMMALVAFPLLGHLAGLSQEMLGFWAGLSINDTSQVVAAGAAYGEGARDVAVVVKLVRNALMAPIIVVVSWWAVRSGGGEARRPAQSVRTAVPLFVLGFLIMATLRSAGAISADLAGLLGAAASICITVALAGVGLGTRLSELAHVGLRPFIVGMGAATVLAVVGLLLAGVVAPGAA